MNTAPILPRNDAVLTFLANRRSCLSKTLLPPVPDRQELREILTIASRAPDHGKLVPWRFVILERDDCVAYATAVMERAMDLHGQEKRARMAANTYANKHLCVVVIERGDAQAAIPIHEQRLAVGGVCFNLLSTCLACGWGTQWLTGWTMEDRTLIGPLLGVKAQERVAGMFPIGTPTEIPAERPRPEMGDIVQWGLAANEP